MTTTYTAQHNFFDKARKAIEKANKRAERYGLNGVATIIDERTTEIDVHSDDNTVIGTRVQWELEVEADPFENAEWELVAALDFVGEGAVVRCLPGKNLDGVTRPDDRVCEHCGTRRNRSKSYMVRHLDSGELKQVGSSCLLAYTGFDPKFALFASTFLDSIAEIADEQPEHSGSRTPIEFSIDAAIRMALAASNDGRKFVTASVAREQERMSTADEVLFALLPPFGAERPADAARRAELWADFHQVDDARVNEIIAYAETIEGSGDYAQNMRAVFSAPGITFRHMGLAVSAIAAHNRHIDREIERAERPQPAAGFIAPVGERVRDIAATVETIREFDTQYGVSSLLVLRAEDGHIIKWFASKPLNLNKGDQLTITGTVKAHEQYQGVDQTVLTRCKLVIVELVGA